MFFFFNDTSTTDIYTYLHPLSLHDALPISQLVDVQLAVLDDAAWDRAGSRRAAKLLQPCIQSSPALGQPFAGSQRHGEPRGLLYRLWRDQKLLEVAIAARSRQPYVTGPEGVADVEQHRDFPKPV